MTNAAFEREVLVRFGHCDPAGIVFFPRYYELLNAFVEDWFNEGLGVSYAELLGPRRIGLPTVHLEADFKAVSHLGDPVALTLAVERIGNSSLTLNLRCVGRDNGDRNEDDVRMTLRQVIVTTDLKHHKAIPIPPDLRAAISESGATVSNDPLPAVEADDVQLAQLFQNLIGNALKFRSQSVPRIHISVSEKDAEFEFSVADNGIGIEPQYFERIFMVFQRLHDKGRYPGTGIGLAICKKVVELHGGRIWAESEPDRGSTFYFTLPRTAPAESRERHVA